MSYQKILLAILFSGTLGFATGQPLLTGFVLDSASMAGVPDVNVRVKGKQAVTTTNIHGKIHIIHIRRCNPDI